MPNKFLTIVVFVAYFVLVSSSCAVERQPQFPNTATAQESPQINDEIKLERTECLGTCPVYTLTIQTDGTVIFNGRSFTGTKGEARGKIEPEKLQELFLQIEKANFFALKNSYVEEKDGCGQVWTDSPMEIISITFAGRSKTVRHYFGCEKLAGDDLSRIVTIGTKIDEASNSGQWTKGWKPEKSEAKYI